MTTPAELFRRVVHLLQRDRLTAELEEEMRLHRDLRARRLEESGVPPDDARRVAQRRFGNTTSHGEASRDMWGMQGIENMVADVRFAVRRLRNRPAFALSTIAVAALGIGATTAVFSAVDAALLRPLPFHKPHELVTLPGVDIPFDPGSYRRRGPEPYSRLTVTQVSAMRDVVASVAAYAPAGMNLEEAQAARRVRVGVVTTGFFSTLGIIPSAGRVFSADEGKPGGPRVVILSDALWRSQYGASSVIGRKIMLHGNAYEVIGIMPRQFSFPAESDLWIPLTVPTTPETFAPFRGFLPSKVVARLARGMTPEQATRRLLAEWERRLPPPQAGQRSNIATIVAELRKSGAAIPLQQNIVGARKRAFMILLGATVLLLLIASANVANLLLSDGASRRREVALREVLGASRIRVVRQLLAESLVLSVSGALVGLALAPLALGLLQSLLPEAILGTTPIRIDSRVLAFATLLALITGTAFGLWPALDTSRVDPGETIKSGGHGATPGKLGITRRSLIIAELGLTVILLVGSGLMLKSFHRLMSQDLGMETEHVGTFELTFAAPGAGASSGAAEAARRVQVARSIVQRLAADGQMKAVGFVNDLPLRGGGGISVGIELAGTPTPADADFPRYLIVGGDYFEAMGIRLIAGRHFEASDDSIGPRYVIVSKATADAYWPGMNAIGRGLYFGGDSSVLYTVAGIVADVREGSLDEPPTPQLYFPAEERGVANLAVVARSSLPAAQLLARMDAAVREVAPTQAIFNLRMMEDVVASSVAPRRTNTVLITVFGALALILSAFGVYAVVSYSVAQRSREFGIRAALGADRANILGLVGLDMARLLATGLALGLAGAWALSRVLASVLYEVHSHDASTYFLVPIVLVVPAAVATLVPALRAMRVSPTEVMRAE
jgi:predicted permease